MYLMVTKRTAFVATDYIPGVPVQPAFNKQKVLMRMAFLKLLKPGCGELRSGLMMLCYHVHLAKNVEDNLENPHDEEFICMSFREGNTFSTAAHPLPGQ